MNEAAPDLGRRARADTSATVPATTRVLLVVPLATLVVYFVLPAFWVKPLSLLPGARPYIQQLAAPIRPLCEKWPAYRAFLRWQSELVNLR